MATSGSFWYRDNSFRYHIIPPVFLVFFTVTVQYLAIVGQGNSFTVDKAWKNNLGNCFSWWFVMSKFIWAFIWLKMAGRTTSGPETLFGHKPIYKDNGVQYYLLTTVTYLVLHSQTSISSLIYDNMPQILGTLSNTALLLCTWLLVKGKFFPEHKNDKLAPTPILYEFYRGVELNPKILGVDVKQMTNCRIGMMGWQVYILAYYFTSLERNGFDLASLTCLLGQTVYIAKFFWWESGYFHTIDMMVDRAGYYLCYGAVVWIPCLFAYSSYYIVAHPPVIGGNLAIFLLVLGVSSLFLTYRVDCEKLKFRSSPNFKCQLWGKPADFLLVKYKDLAGNEKTSALLLSGFWGIARHTNYSFEMVANFSWAACGLGLGHFPFFCCYFLTIFTIHRVFRDEDKCKKKYGKYWDEYCKRVPYRMIPYIW